MGGWAWTASQAHFQGHFMDKDVEKPVCSQVSIDLDLLSLRNVIVVF